MTSGKWTGRAQAYAETFAGLCAELVEPLLDELAPEPGQRLLDIGTGTGAVVDPALWWSGPTSGVARIGQIYLAQTPQKAAAMASAYHRLSAAYLEPDGQLHLPAAALLVVARRPA